MKLNLGSGFNKLEGYINVDKDPICLPDVLLSLDTEEWPWPDNSVDEALLDHVLEHLGETTEQYFHVMRELYRVCKAGAIITVKVPHPNHENFLHDPTHVRAITPVGLAMFGKQRNLDDLANGGKESKLGLSIDVDFAVTQVTFSLEPKWMIQVQNKIISDEAMMDAMRTQLNVCYEIVIVMQAIKEVGNE